MAPDRGRHRRLPTRPALLAVVAASALACGTQAPSASSPPLGSPGSSVAPASGGAGLPSAALSSGDTPPYGGTGPVVVENMSAGLEALGSYRSRLEVTFRGSDAVAPGSWDMSVTVLHLAAQSVTSVHVETHGAGAPLPPTHEVERDGQTYLSAGGPCAVRPSGEGASIIGLITATRLLPSVVGATSMGREPVGGVEADRLSFDAAAVGLAGVADGTGLLWVAVSGGAVLKESLSLTGAGFPYGENTPGTMTWEYNLMDVGSALTVDPPYGCSIETLDLPVLTNATDVQRGPRVISFDTPSTPAEVAAFYKDTGTAAGWTFASKPYADADRGLVKATVAGRAITIVITGTASGSSVIVEVAE